MVPLLKLENLLHCGKDTDPSLFWRSKNIVSPSCSQVSTQLKDGGTISLEVNTMLGVTFNRRQFDGTPSQNDETTLGNMLRFVLVHPRSLLYREDEPRIIVRVVPKIVLVCF